MHVVFLEAILRYTCANQQMINYVHAVVTDMSTYDTHPVIRNWLTALPNAT